MSLITWVSGLYHASESDKLAQEFARLPKEIAANPRFVKHQGMIAQIARPLAARAYRRAFAFEPFNRGICYRLRFVLRQAEETSEFEWINRLYETYNFRSAHLALIISEFPSPRPEDDS